MLLRSFHLFENSCKKYSLSLDISVKRDHSLNQRLGVQGEIRKNITLWYVECHWPWCMFAENQCHLLWVWKFYAAWNNIWTFSEVLQCVIASCLLKPWSLLFILGWVFFCIVETFEEEIWGNHIFLFICFGMMTFWHFVLSWHITQKFYFMAN
jgi:hypothetical protein